MTTKAKRLCATLLLAVMLASLMLTLSACIFNDGSEDELEGIYGLKEYFFRSREGGEKVYALEYDYYLLVLYKDKTAKVIYRKTGESEVVADTTYKCNISDNVVGSISLGQLYVKQYNGGNPVAGNASNYTLSFYPMREDLVNRDARLVKNAAGTVTSEVLKISFNKIYERISDRKIEKAKKKQIESLSEREQTTDAE